jgi:hypothetical protein
MDGAVYIIASIIRCDPADDDKVRCAMDVSAAIESVNKMVTVIVKAVDKCGAITTDKPECGISISELTRSLAGLTSASAGIVAKCPNDVNGGHPMATVGSAMAAAATTAGGSNTATNTAQALGGGFNNHFGQCIVNVKDSVKQLFKAVKRSLKLSDDCGDTSDVVCVHSSIMVVDAFVGLAEYISGAVAKCSTNIAASTTAMCSQMSDKLTRAAGDVVQASTLMAEKCEITPAERLYLDSHKPAVAAPASNNGLTLALATFLPVTAVVSFVGGRRMAKARAATVPLDDEEMLVQSE